MMHLFRLQCKDATLAEIFTRTQWTAEHTLMMRWLFRLAALQCISGKDTHEDSGKRL